MDEVVKIVAASNPILFLLVFATVLVTGGIAMLLIWRIIGGYEKVKTAIQSMIDAGLAKQRDDTESKFAAHFQDETGWRSRFETAQQETLDRVAALSTRVEDLASDVSDVKALVRGMEAERAFRHEREEVTRRQIELLVKKQQDNEG